jgi:hypothetical protein
MGARGLGREFFFVSKKRFFLEVEPLAKLLRSRGSRYSGQAKRDPESSIFEQFLIPAFARRSKWLLQEAQGKRNFTFRVRVKKT